MLTVQRRWCKLYNQQKHIIHVKCCVTILNITKVRLCAIYYKSCLPSLFTTVIVVLPGSATPTLLGSEDESIVRVKVLFPSHIISSLIGTLNGILVTSAGNVTVYGLEL